MSEHLQLLRTGDGSYTLYDPELDETYHSLSGAVSESRHVFLERGFYAPSLQARRDAGAIRILEVGFGTGLNAQLTWKEADREKIAVQYEALEPYPLPNRVLESLAGKFEEASFRRVHQAPWERTTELSPYFSLLKRELALEGSEDGPPFDLIYFDAFGAKVRSDMWEETMLDLVLRRGREGTVFVTYAARGSLKRALGAAGWKVERLEGALGKREMVRGIKKGAE
jgi:tRNA U34 5-methylaminomethyl-2-thiouridine-forming methyltransferase MnmC